MYWRPFAIPTGKSCPVCGQASGHSRPVMTLTKDARMYRSEVAVALRKQLGTARIQPYRTPVQVDMELRAPDRRRRDVDNFSKGVLDALTHAQVWADDSLVDVLNIRRGPVIKGGAVVLLISALDPQADPLPVPPAYTPEF